jgi:hypothetical protein
VAVIAGMRERCVSRFAVTPLAKGRSTGILVTSAHFLYYPCQVVLLTAEGKVLREYRHSGHLNFIESADLDGDGSREYYLAGISNAHHAATIVVLNPEHFGGASREKEAEDYQLLGFEHGSEQARIILPRSCLNIAADPYNTVATFSAGPEEIVVQTGELIGVGAGIFHHLSPDFKRYRAVISDSYKIEYQKALQEGRLRGCSADRRALQVLAPEATTN